MGGQFTIAGLVTTWLLHGVLAVLFLAPLPDGCLGFGANGDAEAEPKGERLLIQASIAFKKPKQQNQPQKKRRQRRKKKKVGVSRDADAKRPDKKKEDDAEPSWEDFKRDPVEEEDLDLEEGKPPPKMGGSFDGKEFGWAEKNEGHPYMQNIVRWLEFEVPTLEKGTGSAQACIRLLPDGTIKETKIEKKSGNTNIDRAADEAMRKLQNKLRGDKTSPVPPELAEITNKWLCFKLGV